MFESIVKKIKHIIGTDQMFTIELYSGQICFCVYEREVVISYTANDNFLCIDCELTDGKLDTEAVNELNEIMNLLEANKDLLRSLCI